MKWTVGAKIGSGFAVSVAILVIVGAASYRSMNRLTEAAELVTHTNRVLERLDGLQLGLANAETGQRGYIITSDEAYLEPYHDGTALVQQATRDLRSLTENSPSRQRALETIEPLVAQRLATLKGGIDTLRTKDPEAARQWIVSGKGKAEMDSIYRAVGQVRDDGIALLKERSDEAQAFTRNTRLTILAGTFASLAVSVLAGFLITRSISGRLREVTAAARRVADGDLTGGDLAVRSQDEVGELATAFTTMQANLKDMASQIRLATENMNSTAAEVLASTRQQAAAAEEQAATVQEITGTIEEINQSGLQIGERAKQVAAAIEATSTVGSLGLKATKETSQTMEAIRTQVEEVAENVVSLCERTQTVGEIIATVSEIAEQSNLLALNASIEAVSAGAHGGRFSVVAHEMKNLADRAKDCTVQVRTILADVQKGINSSVMLTEGAVKRVESGKQQAGAAESTIRDMSEMTERCTQAFQQILGGTGQQQIGVTQVTQGMQDIRQAVTQTAAGTAQLEKSAANLNALNQQLRTAVNRYRF
jgi:methyl-accepting chemotaxis protein